MSKPKAPPAPDYAGAARQQGQDNLVAARQTDTASRPDQFTPWGSQTWTQDASNPDKWATTISLDPAQQQLLDAQNQISQSLAGTAQQNLGRVGEAQAQPFSMGGLPSLNGAPGAPNLQTSLNGAGNIQSQLGDYGSVVGADQFKDYGDKAFSQLMARQNQGFDLQDKSLQQQLANQGITPGSEAYNRAYQPLEQSRVDATNQAGLASNSLMQSLVDQANQAQQQRFGQALGSGGFTNQAQAQQYGQDLGAGQFGNNAAAQQFAMGLSGNEFGNQARQQGIQEQSYLRNLPLNELNALRTGSQITAPQFSQYNAANVAPPPTFQGTQAQGNWDQQNYANQVGGFNNMMTGLFGLGTAGINKYSDRRLKRNIEHIGTSPRGYPWYKFEYVWGDKSEGVMADEVDPSAVITGPDGYAMVDYRKV
jgi:hypothetical protein